MLRFRVEAFATLLTASLYCGLPAFAQRVAGEPSLTPRPAPAQWKLQGYPETRAARLSYGALPAARLRWLERDSTGLKAQRIGVARAAAAETAGAALPALRWTTLAHSGAVARVVVSSPDARALRVGLALANLHDRDELRFAGSADPTRVVAVLDGRRIKRMLDAQGLFWTPSTDGQTQTIELFRPAGIAQPLPSANAPALSHLVADSRSGFKLAPVPGGSGSCNVDTVCRVPELGARYVDAENSVAHMQFVVGATTYICTGTLLNDGAANTQVPWFYGANHCFTDNDDIAPVPAQMQAVANTLNTFWNYEATACGNGTSAPMAQLAGGSDYLYSDHLTDGMFLRLRDPAPAGAFFAGWNASALPVSTTIFGIHHPRGDLKKVSSGQTVAGGDASSHFVGWLSGTTEGGSSGSALFTATSAGYELRGGLFGGSASCANTGSLSNPQNRDIYSRFDVVYPNIRRYLEGPIERNGSQPLLPPRGATASGAQTERAATPASAAPASAGRRTGVDAGFMGGVAPRQR